MSFKILVKKWIPGAVLIVVALFCCVHLAPRFLLSSPGRSSFDEAFTGQTLRVDFYHSGTSTEEHISLDTVRLEGPWPGSRSRLLDQTNRGKYFFEIRSAASDVPLYSRGFAGIFGEWETIGEARQGTWRTFQESVRFPEPRLPFHLVLRKRAASGSFEPIFSVNIDPKNRFVDRSPITAFGTPWTLFENGEPTSKVDLLILGDGYTAEESGKFHEDVKRLADNLFATEPFLSRKEDFNVRAIDVASPDPGISNPRAGEWHNSVLGLEFNSFDLDRYVLTYRNRVIREIAAQLPYDALLIVFNSPKYGGGGIFGLWSTCSSDSEWSTYVFVHEFGHSFGGLGDEYYSSDVAYEDFTPPGVEPWEPNITALLDPAALKWKELVSPGTPIPTPWNKAAYDLASGANRERRAVMVRDHASAADLSSFDKESGEELEKILRSDPYFGRVGAFQGAGYESLELYRPSVDCIMFTKYPKAFCPVCRKAIEEMIDLYSRTTSGTQTASRR